MKSCAFSPAFHLFFRLLPLLAVPISADPLFTFCFNQNYTMNTPFERNLKIVLKSLTSNTSFTGFNETSAGDGSGSVFGQALCRGDVGGSVCQDCIRNASQEILNLCKTKDAIIWYEKCQLRYSSDSFFSTMVYTGKYPESNKQEKAEHIASFGEGLRFLMRHLGDEASASHNKLMFAVGESKVSKKTRIYGLVQCTRDISGDYCLQCLESAVGDLIGCCNSTEGGMVLSRNCDVRFQLYSFYSGPSPEVPNPYYSEGKWSSGMLVAVIGIPALVIALLIGAFLVCRSQRKRTILGEETRSQQVLLNEVQVNPKVNVREEVDFVSSKELELIDVATIRAATDDFSSSNKIGQGGFATVYKGVLGNGKVVAIKRLSKKSWQGLQEFKNEVLLIAKLQHRNLVRLLAWGIEGDEKLLIYDFMPNKSLDLFIFDSEKRSLLDWKTCFEIINGIARGLLYLHEDSRPRVIHRDLKPSNILLDDQMVAKISDFGMARIFCDDQDTANATRVLGTYGYMAPEYAMGGLFSVKSDVFSFGVVLLEIISGKRNISFDQTKHAQSLLAYAWQLWEEGKELELMDPSLTESCSASQVVKCIKIGLLCVQEDPDDRPTMADVAVLLASDSITLPEPGKPGVSVGSGFPTALFVATDSFCNATVSSISPR